MKAGEGGGLRDERRRRWWRRRDREKRAGESSQEPSRGGRGSGVKAQSCRTYARLTATCSASQLAPRANVGEPSQPPRWSSTPPESHPPILPAHPPALPWKPSVEAVSPLPAAPPQYPPHPSQPHCEDQTHAPYLSSRCISVQHLPGELVALLHYARDVCVQLAPIRAGPERKPRSCFTSLVYGFMLKVVKVSDSATVSSTRHATVNSFAETIALSYRKFLVKESCSVEYINITRFAHKIHTSINVVVRACSHGRRPSTS